MGQMTEVLLNGAMYRRFVNQRLAPVYDTYDLNAVDVKVILFLQSCGTDENRMSDIVKQEATNKGLISQSVAKLHERGLVDLQEDAVDRRVRHLSLTNGAEQVAEDLRTVYEEIHREVFDGVDAGELRSFLRVTEKIVENLNEMAGIE